MSTGLDRFQRLPPIFILVLFLVWISLRGFLPSKYPACNANKAPIPAPRGHFSPPHPNPATSCLNLTRPGSLTIPARPSLGLTDRWASSVFELLPGPCRRWRWLCPGRRRARAGLATGSDPSTHSSRGLSGSASRASFRSGDACAPNSCMRAGSFMLSHIERPRQATAPIFGVHECRVFCER